MRRHRPDITRGRPSPLDCYAAAKPSFALISCGNSVGTEGITCTDTKNINLGAKAELAASGLTCSAGGINELCFELVVQPFSPERPIAVVPFGFNSSAA